jgi:hypothetical protein
MIVPNNSELFGIFNRFELFNYSSFRLQNFSVKFEISLNTNQYKLLLGEYLTMLNLTTFQRFDLVQLPLKDGLIE